MEHPEQEGQMDQGEQDQMDQGEHEVQMEQEEQVPMGQIEQEDPGRQGLQEPFPPNALNKLFSFVTFSALKRLRLICRDWNTYISHHSRIKYCRGVLRQDWITKARGLNFESTLKWKDVFFHFFPFNRNTIFDKYWKITGQNVTIVYFKYVKISCDRMVKFLMSMPHLTDVTFKQCNFELTRMPIKDTRNRPRKLSCACPHENLELPEGTEMILPKITRLVLIKEDYFPLCVLDLLRQRSRGILEEFRFDHARMARWRRMFYRPIPARIDDFVFNIVQLNVNTIRIFSYFRNYRGELFFQRLIQANIRLRLDLTTIGQQSSWNFTQTADGFINYLNFLDNERLKHLSIRFIHRYTTPGLSEALLLKMNLQYLFIDTVWSEDQNAPLDLAAVLPHLTSLKELVIRDRNHRQRPSINDNYLDNLSPNLTKLTFYGYYIQAARIDNFMRSNAARRLTELVIEGGRQITDAIMQTIINTLIQLEVLAVNDSTFLTDAGVTGLPLDTCKRIIQCNSRLLLSGNVPVMDNLPGVPVSRMTNLKKLSFGGCRKLSDVTVFIGIRFPKLMEIDLSQCLDVTDFGILNLAKNNPSLERIIVMKNLKITHYGLNLVLEANPCIENIHTSKKVRDRNMGNQLQYKVSDRFLSAVTYKRWDERRARPMGTD